MPARAVQGILIALFVGFQLLAYLALTTKANGNVQ